VALITGEDVVVSEETADLGIEVVAAAAETEAVGTTLAGVEVGAELETTEAPVVTVKFGAEVPSATVALTEPPTASTTNLVDNGFCDFTGLGGEN
jgi:hypothetical protein